MDGKVNAYERKKPESLTVGADDSCGERRGRVRRARLTKCAPSFRGDEQRIKDVLPTSQAQGRPE